MKKNNEEVNVPYFAEREEQAVINYIKATTAEEKNKIYNEILLVPFRKMIESILRRYPIHIGNYDIVEVESNARSHLIEHMIKFNPDKITKSGNKAKAYSYCQTIIRNYYKDHSKKSYIEKKTNLCFDDYIDEINENVEYSYEIETETQHQFEKLINTVVAKIEDKIDNDPTMKKMKLLLAMQ